METLSKKELTRQDFVDNEIFDLFKKLIPKDKKLEWDIEAIGAIRDVMRRYIVAKKIMTEKQFYPYRNEFMEK